jgi:hypothetical protein
MERGPWYDTGRALAARWGQSQATCTCCGRSLSSENRAVRWLELDQRTDTYHDLGGVPADKSQGWFPFGLACAKKEISRHRAALAKAKEKAV